MKKKKLANIRIDVDKFYNMLTKIFQNYVTQFDKACDAYYIKTNANEVQYYYNYVNKYVDGYNKMFDEEISIANYDMKKTAIFNEYSQLMKKEAYYNETIKINTEKHTNLNEKLIKLANK